MKEIGYKEYLEFIQENAFLVLNEQKIPLEPIQVKRLVPEQKELGDTATTVWSFPHRGSWATHKGNYRGNWSPQIAKYLIENYTSPGEVVLDPMCGSGTTGIEARLLGRNSHLVDINYNAVMLTLHRLYWLEHYARNKEITPSTEIENIKKTYTKTYNGDARNLHLLESDSVDLIATHPPYWGIIKYNKKQDGDLSSAGRLEDYVKLLYEVAKECYRVLKPGRYLGILTGDTRKHAHYVPLSYYLFQAFLDAGFLLKEEIIKIQHKMKTTREIWNRKKQRNFLLIYHEKLYIFRKPEDEKDRKKHKESGKLEKKA